MTSLAPPGRFKANASSRDKCVPKLGACEIGLARRHKAGWSVLTNYTTLAPGQTWQIQLGSIDNANDHNWISADVAGNRNPGDTPLSWSDPIAVVPEPSIALLFAAGGLLVAWRARRRPGR